MRAVEEYYPQLARVGSPPQALEAWQGIFRPFARCPKGEMVLVVNDLEVGAQVLVGGGSLRHDPKCPREHDPIAYSSRLAGIENETFAIRTIVPPAPRHPRAIAIFPEISAARFPKHPHLFRNLPPAGLPEFPGCDPDALCPYRPGDGEWSCTSGDLVLFFDYVAIYLAKHAIWVRTGADRDGNWIGPQASHEPTHLVAELDPKGECRCGSGNQYGKCCRPFDVWRITMKHQTSEVTAVLRARSRAAA